MTIKLKNLNALLTVLTIIFFMSVGIWTTTGFIADKIHYWASGPEQPPPLPMQSVMDKQQELVDLGYDIAVDGKLGPETQRAWDAAWDNENFRNEVFE
jgi:hypothetical protein